MDLRRTVFQCWSLHFCALVLPKTTVFSRVINLCNGRWPFHSIVHFKIKRPKPQYHPSLYPLTYLITPWFWWLCLRYLLARNPDSVPKQTLVSILQALLHVLRHSISWQSRAWTIDTDHPSSNPASSLMSCMTLGELLKLSKLQFPYF